MDCSVVIVSFNVRQYLLNCIRSVQQASAGFAVEIIVVDNASEDQSAEAVSQAFPDVRVIRNSFNVGFGPACNQGAAVATGEFLLFLNPDSLAGDSVFPVLIPFMKSNPDVGLAGCKVLNADGSLQLACRRSFPSLWVSFTRMSGLSRLFPRSPLFARYNLTYLDENEIAEPDAVSGAFLLVRRDIFNQIGGFDDEFFMYGEDLDLCYRVRQAGYRIVYHPGASVIHFKGRSQSTTVDTRYHFYESMKIFVRKHSRHSPIFLAVLNLAISGRYILALLRQRVMAVSMALTDMALLLILFEGISFFRHGRLFGYPDYAYPIIYLIMFSVQLAVYSVSGVYRDGLSARRRRVAGAAILTWVVIALLAYFSKDFAFSRFILVATCLGVGFSHLGYRELIRMVRKSSPNRQVLVITTNGGLYKSDWFRLWSMFLESQTIHWHLVESTDSSPQILGNLPELVRLHGLTGVVLDTDVFAAPEQVHWIQACRQSGLQLVLLSEASLKETLANDILRRPDQTGLIYRIAKRFTDGYLIWLAGRKNNLEKPSGRFWIGNPSRNRRPAVFPAVYTLNACFPSVRSDEDQYLLTLFYNRFHSMAMDRKILRYLTEKEKLNA